MALSSSSSSLSSLSSPSLSPPRLMFDPEIPLDDNDEQHLYENCFKIVRERYSKTLEKDKLKVRGCTSIIAIVNFLENIVKTLDAAGPGIDTNRLICLVINVSLKTTLISSTLSLPPPPVTVNYLSQYVLHNHFINTIVFWISKYCACKFDTRFSISGT